MSPEQYVSSLIDTMQEHAVPADVDGMERYMKNQFEFFGIRSPARRQLIKEFVSQHGLPSAGNWKEIIELCWEDPRRELQYVAMDWVLRLKKYWQSEDLLFFEMLITTKSWWDTVDFLASNVMGHYLLKFPENLNDVVESWRTSDNMWLNRTALLYQLKYKERTDFERLKTIIMTHRQSKEFFIRKAIGWSLRQYSNTNPTAVKSFVGATELAPLSRREALKNIK